MSDASLEKQLFNMTHLYNALYQMAIRRDAEYKKQIHILQSQLGDLKKELKCLKRT